MHKGGSRMQLPLRHYTSKVTAMVMPSSPYSQHRAHAQTYDYRKYTKTRRKYGAEPMVYRDRVFEVSAISVGSIPPNYIFHMYEDY